MLQGALVEYEAEPTYVRLALWRALAANPRVSVDSSIRAKIRKELERDIERLLPDAEFEEGVKRVLEYDRQTRAVLIRSHLQADTTARLVSYLSQPRERPLFVLTADIGDYGSLSAEVLGARAHSRFALHGAEVLTWFQRQFMAMATQV